MKLAQLALKNLKMQSYSQLSYVSIYFLGVVKFSTTETAWSNVFVNARPVPGPVAN